MFKGCKDRIELFIGKDIGLDKIFALEGKALVEFFFLGQRVSLHDLGNWKLKNWASILDYCPCLLPNE